MKILILEDNADDAGLTLRALKKSDFEYETRITDNKKDYIAALHSFRPDIILSDHSLPSFTSSEALPLSRDICKNSVFILVTGTVSEEFAVSIIKAGADDYILKSSLTRLPSAIMNAYTRKIAEMERAQHVVKLNEVNNELKTFMYRASHDIRGPLSSMRGLINVAKIEKESSEMNKLIKMMDSSAEKLDRIVVDLIETLGIRDMALKKEEISLKELATEIISEFENTLKAEKLRFYVEANCLSVFYSDKIILKMVLKRIIDNSVKFHNYSVPGSYVTVNIKTDAEGAQICIADNGVGIREDLIEKVFEMFYRANGESDGSGLGLYLARLGTEKLGGRIELKSMQQIGTTVIVSIPSL